ncbi:MAG: DUF799 family lipoprotein [Paludibacter sp.]|nr:DUF799 family lipoprotein [Paludibacter sp.]
MKKTIIFFAVIAIAFSSCTTTKPVLKTVAYKGMYSEKPLSILIMPPINQTTAVDAKEYFHSTLNVPLANAGYYVIPPFLSMEILKKESAYDAELFLKSSLAKFGEIFGADMVLFTIINKWDKSYGNVSVGVEYVVKSTKTNEILYDRKGTINYNTSFSGSGGGLVGALVNVAATAINTAATKYVDVARVCNGYTLNDLPNGKYAPEDPKESEEFAGENNFNVNLNSKYGY